MPNINKNQYQNQLVVIKDNEELRKKNNLRKS